MKKLLIIIFIFFSLFTVKQFDVDTAFAECCWYDCSAVLPETNQCTVWGGGWWESRPPHCSSCNGSGGSQCFPGSCGGGGGEPGDQCPSGGDTRYYDINVIATDTGQRYTQNGCPNGSSGATSSCTADLESSCQQCAVTNQTVCNAEGGKMEGFTFKATDTTITLTTLPSGYTNCTWEIGSLTGTGCATIRQDAGNEGRGALRYTNGSDPTVRKTVTFYIYPETQKTIGGRAYCFDPVLGSNVILPFTNIYIQNTTNGTSVLTTTNSSGDWSATKPIAQWTNPLNTIFPLGGATTSCPASNLTQFVIGNDGKLDETIPHNPNGCFRSDINPLAVNFIADDSPICGEGEPLPTPSPSPSPSTTPNPICGNNIPETGEQCDDGTYNQTTNPDGNQNESDCDLNCRTRVQMTGRVVLGDGTATKPPYGVCSGGPEDQLPDLESSDTIIIRGGDLQNAPNAGIKTVPINSDGTFSTWIRNTSVAGTPLGTVEVQGPGTIGINNAQCPGSPNPGWYRGLAGKLPRNQSNVKIFYADPAVAGGSAWYQVIGGSLYSETNIISLLPQADDYFVRRVGFSDYLSAGIPWAANTIDLGLGFATQREIPGENNDNTPNQKIQDTGHDFAIDGYEYYYKKFDVANQGYPVGPLVQSDPTCTYPNNGDSTRICKNLTDSVVTFDLNSTWNVNSSTKTLIFIDGDLIIKDSNNVGNLFNVSKDGGFFGFIVKGSITFDETVGNSTLGDETPNVEGLFLANSITIDTNEGTDDKFIGEGIFTATGGPITLQRDLGSNNGILPGELFIFRPDLSMNMPDLMKSVTMEYQEVN